jgi:hypothetical protein
MMAAHFKMNFGLKAMIYKSSLGARQLAIYKQFKKDSGPWNNFTSFLVG